MYILIIKDFSYSLIEPITIKKTLFQQEIYFYNLCRVWYVWIVKEYFLFEQEKVIGSVGDPALKKAWLLGPV